MMLTIHGLPSFVKFQDLKKLIREECKIFDFILDNLITDDDGVGKKMRVGMADEREGAILMQCLDGFRMTENNILRVVPVAKPAPNLHAHHNPEPVRHDHWGQQPNKGPWVNNQQGGVMTKVFNQYPQQNASPGNTGYSQGPQMHSKPFGQRDVYPENRPGLQQNQNYPFQQKKMMPSPNNVPMNQSLRSLRNIDVVENPRDMPPHQHPYSAPHDRPTTISKDKFQGPSQFMVPGPGTSGQYPNPNQQMTPWNQQKQQQYPDKMSNNFHEQRPNFAKPSQGYQREPGRDDYQDRRVEPIGRNDPIQQPDVNIRYRRDEPVRGNAFNREQMPRMEPINDRRSEPLLRDVIVRRDDNMGRRVDHMVRRDDPEPIQRDEAMHRRDEIIPRQGGPIMRNDPMPRRDDPMPTRINAMPIRNESMPMRREDILPIRRDDPMPIRREDPMPIRREEPIQMRRDVNIPRRDEPVNDFRREVPLRDEHGRMSFRDRRDDIVKDDGRSRLSPNTISPGVRRHSPDRRVEVPVKRPSPSRGVSPGRRSSPHRYSPTRGLQKIDHRETDMRTNMPKQVRPAYEPTTQGSKQPSYSVNYHPKLKEESQYPMSGPRIEQRPSWQDRDKNTYQPKADDGRRDYRPEYDRTIDYGERKDRSRSPVRRYKQSPSRSPRRSWALEKRPSPPSRATPPPPVWPGGRAPAWDRADRDKAEPRRHWKEPDRERDHGPDYKRDDYARDRANAPRQDYASSKSYDERKMPHPDDFRLDEGPRPSRSQDFPQNEYKGSEAIRDSRFSEVDDRRKYQKQPRHYEEKKEHRSAETRAEADRKTTWITVPPAVKMKRDKVIEVLTNRLCLRHNEKDLRVRDELKVQMSKTIQDMYGSMDVTPSVMLTDFDNKYSKKDQDAIYEDVISSLPARKRRSEEKDKKKTVTPNKEQTQSKSELKEIVKERYKRTIEEIRKRILKKNKVTINDENFKKICEELNLTLLKILLKFGEKFGVNCDVMKKYNLSYTEIDEDHIFADIMDKIDPGRKRKREDSPPGSWGPSKMAKTSSRTSDVMDDDKRPQTVSKQESKKVVTENKKPVAAEMRKPLNAVSKKTVVVETKKPIVVETKKPIAAEMKKPVPVETKKTIVTENKKPVATETKKTVAAETKKPLNAVSKKPVVETKKPVVVETQEVKTEKTPKTATKKEKATAPVEETRLPKDEPRVAKNADGHYVVPPEIARAMQKEITLAVEKILKETTNPRNEAEKKAANILNNSKNEIEEVFTNHLTQRLLNVHNTLLVKVTLSQKPYPGWMKNFIRKYNIVHTKSLAGWKIMSAQVGNFEDFDRLCKQDSIRIAGITVYAKPVYSFRKIPDSIKQPIKEQPEAENSVKQQKKPSNNDTSNSEIKNDAVNVKEKNNSLEQVKAEEIKEKEVVTKDKSTTNSKDSKEIEKKQEERETNESVSDAKDLEINDADQIDEPIDISALINNGIVLDECSGSDEE